MQEGTNYHTTKHKVYIYKVDVSVLPNRLAVSCSEPYPGSISDLEIMQRMRRIHEKYLCKGQGCENFTGIGTWSAES